MDKNRIYLYDNIKGLLIILVVAGHLLEPFLSKNGIEKVIYIIIYSFHMPAFVYCTGVFASFKIRRDLINLMMTYAVFQLLYTIFEIYVLHDKTKNVLTEPYWLLWYLPCVLVWKLINKVVIGLGNIIYVITLTVSSICAILVGFLPKVGYTFTL